MHLNNVNLVERDDHETSYVKFKLFKRDILVSLSGYRQFSERYFSVKQILEDDRWENVRGK